MDEFVEKRLVPRIEFSGKCLCESAGTTMRVVMANLGRDGVFVKTAIPLPVGHHAILNWKLPNEHQVVAQGEVVWASQGGTSIPGMGMRFLEIQEGAEDLGAFLDDVLGAWRDAG